MRSILAGILALALAVDARAEESVVDAVPAAPAPAVEATPAPVQEAAPAPASEPTPAPTPAPPPPLDGWGLYEQAMSAAVAGREAEALGTLATLLARYPRGPAAVPGRELARLVRSRQAGAVEPRGALMPPLPVPRPPPPPTREELLKLLNTEQPTSLARAEFITFQTLMGLTLGGVVGASQISFGGGGGSGAGIFGPPILGLIGGAVYSAQLSSGGITPGRMLSINSATFWSVALAFGTAYGARVDNDLVPLTPLLGLLVGPIVGDVTWHLLRPGAGQVALANSVGFWSGLLALSGAGILSADDDQRFAARVATPVTLAGLVGGAVLARYVPMSRSRSLLIDLGGLVGLYIGGGISNATETRGGDLAAVGISVAAGLGAMTFLTRNWDLPEVPVSVGLTPTEGGAALSLQGAL